MFKAAYEFDTEALDLADRRVVASPKLMERAMKRQQPRLRRRILKIVAVEPGRPSYPLRWASAKQRRYVMAKLRREGKLPYPRTHELVKAWDAKFEFSEDGGAFAVENTSDKARWVVGEDQQPYHADTGWVYGPRVVDEFVPIVLTAYEETWITVSDPFAGVR